MDLRMPVMDGADATAAIRERHPGTQVVVLTTYADDASIVAALSAGASGYLTKDATRDDIRRALEAANAGQAVLDPAVQATGFCRPRRRAVSRRSTEAAPPARVGSAAEARRTDRTRSRSVDANRPGPVQYRNRRAAVRRRGHGKNPRESHLCQDGQS